MADEQIGLVKRDETACVVAALMEVIERLGYGHVLNQKYSDDLNMFGLAIDSEDWVGAESYKRDLAYEIMANKPA